MHRYVCTLIVNSIKNLSLTVLYVNMQNGGYIYSLIFNYNSMLPK